MNFIPNWILKLVGRNIAGKLDLQEDQNMDAKPWYQSKGVLTAIVSAVIGVYQAVSLIHPLPPIPPFVFTLLGAVGLYSLRTADTKIG